MNNYIAAALSLLLLCPMPVQYAINVVNDHNISKMQTIVNSSKEQAKQEGYFTAKIIEKMQKDIATEFNIQEDEIIINVTETPKYRTNGFDERELIKYEVGAPIKKIVAANKLFGIKDEDNTTIYYIEGSTPSEKITEGD